MRFYPQRRVSNVRSSKHFRQAHSKFLSLGIGLCTRLEAGRISATLGGIGALVAAYRFAGEYHQYLVAGMAGSP